MSTTSRTFVVRFSILGALLVTILAISAGIGFAQEPPSTLSDSIKITVNGLPKLDFSITESQEGVPFFIFVPGTIIELTEPNGLISDRMTINPYYINFESDPPGLVGGPPRPGSIQEIGRAHV